MSQTYKTQFSLAQTILDSLIDHIAVLDENGRITQINSVWEKFAIENGDPSLSNTGIGQNYLEICHKANRLFGDRDAKLVLEGLTSIYQKKVQVFTMEYACHSPWEKRWFRLTASSLKFPVGGIVMIHSNITSRKLAELALEETSRKLLKRSEEADVANKAKSDFLMNISHEIRNPLNGVIGFTDLLLRSDLDDSQKKYLDIVFSSAHSLLSILNDIIDFSNTEKNENDLLIEQVSVQELLTQSINMIAHETYKKEIRLIQTISPQVPKYIQTDGLRIKQVLMRLLNNAVKFTEEGEIEISLNLGNPNPDPNKITLIFSVRDTGIGIHKLNQDKIFSSFGQEDNSLNRKYGGTGLGLSIANNILSKLGSKLQLESEVGKGSNFFFEILVNT